VKDHSTLPVAIRVVIVMGVSGAGKTTAGRALAAALRWKFYEGDDFHPRTNIEKMTAGHPLTDADRAPWLAALRQLIDGIIARQEHAVLACSALRRQYRQVLTPDGPDGEAVRFVYLDVPKKVLHDRLAMRQGHFMSAAMLDSQLATLEPPRHAETIDGTLPVDEIARQIRERLSL
jgi:gluconokinase